MNRLKELRKSHSLSQAELAKETGISNQAISFYENGKRQPKIETWQKLANFFKVSVPYIQGVPKEDEELINKISVCQKFTDDIFKMVREDREEALKQEVKKGEK